MSHIEIGHLCKSPSILIEHNNYKKEREIILEHFNKNIYNMTICIHSDLKGDRHLKMSPEIPNNGNYGPTLEKEKYVCIACISWFFN